MAIPVMPRMVAPHICVNERFSKTAHAERGHTTSPATASTLSKETPLAEKPTVK
jgi:hypothetical protein